MVESCAVTAAGRARRRCFCTEALRCRITRGTALRCWTACFATVRYTQRGTRPSDAVPPYTIEAHIADAVAVLDWMGVEHAWAIGHSWGGHLALHLALAHPDRLDGLLLIDPLGAYPAILSEQGRISIAA